MWWLTGTTHAGFCDVVSATIWGWLLAVVSMENIHQRLLCKVTGGGSPQGGLIFILQSSLKPGRPCCAVKEELLPESGLDSRKECQ